MAGEGACDAHERISGCIAVVLAGAVVSAIATLRFTRRLEVAPDK